MGITIKNATNRFKTNISEHAKKKLLELDKKVFLKKEGCDYSFDIHQKEDKKYNLPTQKGADCLRTYAYGNFIFKGEDVFLAQKCNSNKDVLEQPNYEDIYNKISQKFQSDVTTIEETDRVGVKITDDNVDEIVDSINSTLPELSKEYLKLFSRYE